MVVSNGFEISGHDKSGPTDGHANTCTPLAYLNEIFKWHFYSLTLSQTSPGFYISAVQVFVQPDFDLDYTGHKATTEVKGALTHYQTTNFRLFQTERVCRRQFII